MNSILLSCLLALPVVNTHTDDQPKDGLPARPHWLNAERAVRLPDSDWLVYRYSTNSDSGVQVIRADAVMTKVRWQAECQPLGVSHSKYYHRADVEIKNNEAIVSSIANNGHGGTFEERLDLATGKQISRTTK
ncbi:MAG TPA: hypothetical protein PLN21_21085 [Gemmatales bacterium]|nr:hypothetical protein [Gemmatales bacterium]